MGAIGLTEIILIFFVVLFPLIALISILTNKFNGNEKLLWVIVVILIPLVGSILYFVFGTKNIIKKG
jgi:lipopolysaccharide export LptBFGC system permease protein LptF